jgi:hypothetical protein
MSLKMQNCAITHSDSYVSLDVAFRSVGTSAHFVKVDEMSGEEEDVKGTECAKLTEGLIREDTSKVGEDVKMEE